MKCPKCGEFLIYEDQLLEWYDDEDLYIKWSVSCSKCSFEGRMWQNYKLESEEWEEE